MLPGHARRFGRRRGSGRLIPGCGRRRGKTPSAGRGRKAALKAILDGVLHDLSQVEDPTGLRVHILQADCRADAETLRDGIRAAYPQLGEITITGLGVVIGAHCGPGLLTVFYLCGGRSPE